jgi:hypothetical protein
MHEIRRKTWLSAGHKNAVGFAFAVAVNLGIADAPDQSRHRRAASSTLVTLFIVPAIYKLPRPRA